jgi:hypothetical protein
MPKREEVAGDWRKMRNEELHGLYSSGIFQIMKSMRMRWAENLARMGEKRNVYRVLVQNRVGKSLLGKRKCSWKDIMKCILKI